MGILVEMTEIHIEPFLQKWKKLVHYYGPEIMDVSCTSSVYIHIQIRTANVIGWNLVSFLDQVIDCDTTICTLRKCRPHILGLFSKEKI